MNINHPNRLRNVARSLRDANQRDYRNPDQWETLATMLEQAARHIEETGQDAPPIRLSDLPALDATTTRKKQKRRLGHELPKIRKNADYVLRTVNRWIYMGFVTSAYPQDYRYPLELSPVARDALARDAVDRDKFARDVEAVRALLQGDPDRAEQ